MRFYPTHRSKTPTNVRGMGTHYLAYVVIDRDKRRIVSSHISALAAAEQADVLNQQEDPEK